ncbi:hypothetical protein DdX_19236 [Ditylenchus destructor]|uniref:Uncharacterized protein n=1 Tax=Ditylenchus destructor TaxID=166010 RepID=A0AAD4MJ80_9BILA|nr:hypothetical protein DdX_19236 [Ditylenchus destructor]
MQIFVNRIDSGESIDYQGKGDLCEEAGAVFIDAGVPPASITYCYDYGEKVHLTIKKWVNVFEESFVQKCGKNETLFDMRQVGFDRNLGIMDENGNKVVHLKDRKTKLVGKDIYKALYLKDGDELYTHNPTTEPNEAKKIEVGDQDPMVLEEIDALYVMRKH